jgi:phenylacetate-CoA ligase
MTDFHDTLETRDPAERERALLGALPGIVQRAQRDAAAWREILANVDAAAVTTRAALAALPVTRKRDLLARQQAGRARDPFGGLSAIGWRAAGHARPARRVYQSPGPLYEPDADTPDYWRVARALRAAGFRSGDLVHNSYSYHLTPAGAMMESGLHAIGCSVFPGGVGNTELQLQAMLDLQPQGYTGTPSFLKIVLERAAAAGTPVTSLRRALVSGEACPPSLRAWFGEQGVDALQCYATADVGLIAYETASHEGLVIDEGVIVELVHPGGGEPVADGEVGELVVTTLNADYPLIRYGTGDLSAVLPGRCPTGRSNTRIRGWMGRADDTVKVRGMFVHPHQVGEIARGHPEVRRARLVVAGEAANDRMTLRVEVAQAADGLAERIAASVRDVTKLRGEVELCAPGTLPDDGKLIEDARRYD